MKNIKKILTLSLAALTFYGLTSCATVKSYQVEFGGKHKCEGLIKESQICMYKDRNLVARKLPRGDERHKNVDGKPLYEFLEKYTADDPLYEFYDNNGKIFAEARLKHEIITLKDKDKSIEIYGDFTVWDDGMMHNIPLWKELVDMQLEGRGREFLNGKYYKKWYEASDLFVDFLKGEKLLEEKYNKEF